MQANSPAALGGLRFGDQVLQINGQNVAGWSSDKAHKALKAAAEQRIELIVRDRSVISVYTVYIHTTNQKFWVGMVFFLIYK